ncbi:hypothetical protein NECAME_00641, partial [Necator americanus]
MTAKHMEKMLEFDFKYFNEKPAPMHTIPKLLFGRLNMSVSDMDELLKSAEGQKKIQQIIMTFRQPSPPRCVIEAAELWEAMTRQVQFRAQSASHSLQPQATTLSTSACTPAVVSASFALASVTPTPSTHRSPTQYMQQ